jgi:hypothetical protein
MPSNLFLEVITKFPVLFTGKRGASSRKGAAQLRAASGRGRQSGSVDRTSHRAGSDAFAAVCESYEERALAAGERLFTSSPDD